MKSPLSQPRKIRQGQETLSNRKLWNAFLFQSKEVIDLDDEEEIDDVEKEVIDIDTPKKRKAEDQPQAKKAKVDADWEVTLFRLLDMDWLTQTRSSLWKCQKE